MHSLNSVPVYPISVEHPCGVDLEYDPAFIALERAALNGRDQQFGETLIPAAAPDWRQVATSATELLSRTIDLRLFALLTRAWTELHGLEGYARGMTLMVDALYHHWEHIHPQLQADGDFDALPRLNALAALTDREGLGRAARSATLLHWRLGKLSLRDAAAILEGSHVSATSSESSSGAALQSELRAALDSTPNALVFASQALDAIERIAGCIPANLNGIWVHDASYVEAPLRVVLQSAGEFARGHTSEAAQHPALTESIAPQGTESGVQPLASPAGTTTDLPCTGDMCGSSANTIAATAPIHSRNDVLRALDNICRYLERAEPGHPAPLLLRRAQRLMHMSFYEIVRDMAPAALPQLNALVGEPQPPPGRASERNA